MPRRIASLKTDAQRTMNYYEYLKSPHWQQVRRQTWRRAKGQCENWFCHRQGRDVHHLTYARLGQERENDVKLLCRRCHCLAHRRWLDMIKAWRE